MRNLVSSVNKNKKESKKRSEKKTGRDKHGHTKTVGDREGPGIEKKWKQPQKEKIGGQRWAKVEKTSISCFGVKVKNVKKRQTFTVVIVKNIYKQNVWKERDLRFLTNILFSTLSLYSAIFWALNMGLGIDIYFSVPFVSDFWCQNRYFACLP